MIKIIMRESRPRSSGLRSREGKRKRGYKEISQENKRVPMKRENLERMSASGDDDVANDAISHWRFFIFKHFFEENSRYFLR